MNKRLNTALFFVAATVVNVALVIVLALVVFVPYALFVARHVPGVVNLVALIAIFIGSMIGSFPIYRWLVNLFMKKVDMDKYFEPIVKTSAKTKAKRLE
jgi:hypothetical protein